MKFKKRDYQETLIQNARNALRHYKALQIQSATGSGKTATAAFMIESSRSKGLVSGFCVHRIELLEQTANTFESFGIPFGVVANGYAPNYYQPVQIFSIDTLKNRLNSMPIDINVLHIDESHHAKAQGWYDVISHFKKKNAYTIGWSATPQRLDGKPLDVFDGIIQGPQPRELIEQGHLAEYELYSFPCEQGVVVGSLVENWKQKAAGLKTIGFAKTVKLAEEYAQQFRLAGINAVALDANTEKAERRQHLRDFANDKIDVIWNCRLFGEGCDIRALTGLDVRVACVIDSAPSQSLTDWIQRCGRALRPGGRSVILDAAGNYYTHGAPCMDRVWTLEGRDAQRQIDGLKDIVTRKCDTCHMESKGPVKNCTFCGAPFPVSEIRVEHISRELQQVNVDKERQLRTIEQAQARSIDELEELGKSRGNKPGWASHVERARKEKRELQLKLFNLQTTAYTMGLLGHKPNKNSIKKMKPKELKTIIESMEKFIADKTIKGAMQNG